MPFPSRFDNKCSECGGAIKTGQMISWSRREKGKAYHADCDFPDATYVAEPKAAPDIRGMSKEQILAALAKFMDTPSKDKLDDVQQLAPITAKEYQDGARGIEPKKKSKKLGENAQWWDVLSTLTNGLGDKEYIRILLLGPPSSGKSTTSMIEANAAYRVTMTEGSGVEDLMGMFQLVKGETVWVDGPVTKAMREGKRILIDEIDQHKSECGSLMYAILDDHPEVTLMSGERVIAQPGYGVIATTNNNVGSLPEAILDRFEAVILAVQAHPAAVAGLPEQMAAASLNYYKGLNRKPWEWAGKPSVRRVKGYNRMLPIIGEKHASELAFGTAAKEMLGIFTTAGR